MKLEDVQNYIIRKNLDLETRKQKVIDERMYLYAYLYHFLNVKDLTLIGKMFGKKDEFGNIIKAKDRITVRHSLIKAHDIQFHNTFIEHTKELNDQIPIVIPKYEFKERLDVLVNKDKSIKNGYKVTLKITKRQFGKYLETQDKDLILDILFKCMLEAVPKINKSRNQNIKPIDL